ncbi:MAG: sigma-70 family RNA polymerase sigma factor [Rhodospirillales bacterium]
MLDLIPALRAFSRALCNDPTRADDLAQETLLKAWGARESFTVGTNLKAWLFTIARNTYYSDHRRRGREVEDPDGIRAASLPAAPEQFTEIQKRDLRRALARLPAEQREAIMLVGAGGCSYEEAASICGCAVGTIKSRVSRARRAIMIYMEGEEAGAPAGEGSGPAAENAEEIEKPRRIARL